MVNDLPETHSFSGRSREEVEHLLGPADDLPEQAQGWNFALVYYLGADRSFLPIDNEWLGFEVDEEGRVVHVQTFVD